MCPLAGLTNPDKSFLLLGRLKKGAPKTGNKPGQDLDHWRPVFLASRDTERIKERFLEEYGDRPQDINIRLAFDTIAENWDANYECYKRGVLIAKAGHTDERGVYWIYYRDPETSEVLVRHSMPVGDAGIEFIQKPIDVTKPVYTSKGGNPAFLEPLGRLRVVIPEIAMMSPPVVGFFEVDLTSPNDIRQVSSELAGIEHMANNAGSKISGIPMRLSRMEEEITKNIDGNLTRDVSWMVHISLHGEWATKAMDYTERMALPGVVDAEFEDIPQLESGEEWPEFTEDEPPTPQSKAVVHPTTRPFDPEQLKDWFASHVKMNTENNRQVHKNSPQIVAKFLNEIFGNDTDRYVFTAWVLGKKGGSTKKLNSAEIGSLLDWLGVMSFDDEVNLHSVKEARIGIEFVNKLQGQQKLI